MLVEKLSDLAGRHQWVQPHMRSMELNVEDIVTGEDQVRNKEVSVVYARISCSLTDATSILTDLYEL